MLARGKTRRLQSATPDCSTTCPTIERSGAVAPTMFAYQLRQHYSWLADGLDYFEARLYQAPDDAKFALRYVYENSKTGGDQKMAIQALRDKCDILCAQLDALYFAYVQPGWPPPGAFRMEE